MMVPLQLGVVPQFMLIRELGWMNQLIAVIVPGLVTAFGVFWMRMHIASAVPDEVLQAAKVDGAGTFRTFWSVVLPMIRPAAADPRPVRLPGRLERLLLAAHRAPDTG